MDHTNLCLGCMKEKGSAQTCPGCGYQPETAPGAALFLAPGSLLAGKYLIGRVLGQGGFGITYLARDQNLELRIAVKEFFPQGLVSRVPGANAVVSYTGAVKDQFTFGVESFLREAKTLARFEHHPNIVTVRDFFRENGTAYMVMSFVEGLTLHEYLQQAGGRISAEQAVQIIMPVTDALREVHRAGIMHRDISPDNIFIDKEGRIVLIDFGAARQELRDHSKSLSVILKAGYAPEEQYRSRGKQGPWTDIYAVAATIYRCITGLVPLEAIDRIMDEDGLVSPSQLGVEISAGLEQTLLKALAVKAGARFQSVEEFQAALLNDGAGATKSANSAVWVEAEVDQDKPAASKAQKFEETQKAAVPSVVIRPALADDRRTQRAGSSNSFTKKKRVFNYVVAIVLCAGFLIGGISLFNSGTPPGSDAVYHIDYTGGTIPLGDLPIGARVVDPSWKWEFRTGINYARESGDATKPVTWIVVAKDHYEGLEPHVTLLSEELIGKHAFDNSTNRGSQNGSNHWGESGTANATHGLRPWLNSSGIHSGEGFYRAFPEEFKRAVLATALPNKEWENGNTYSTQDYVFIPSTTELGDSAHNRTYRIGTVYPYFDGAGDAKRVARLDGNTWWYWTRSPVSDLDSFVRYVSYAGEFYYYYGAYFVNAAVRPALNLKSGILVSEINP